MSSTGRAGQYAKTGDPEVTLLLHRTSESHPETELAFLSYDSSSCMTEIDGEPTVFVLRSDVASIVSTLRGIGS